MGVLVTHGARQPKHSALSSRRTLNIVKCHVQFIEAGHPEMGRGTENHDQKREGQSQLRGDALAALARAQDERH